MKKINIVHYNEAYAKSLAKMWNMSGDNWGGNSSVATEQSVIDENKGSGNINTFLAIDNDEVVGYCSLSEYREDEGAMYIPLLNVRPDYHGKKVGKSLVLETVKRTIELGYPRLDLYTWPGNTKAVPLYKKCGFFWEKRDDATHLMNFIPYALNTEAVKGYFENIDWYNNSKRVIEVKPDGEEDKDYGNYRYTWEKGNKRLVLEFERKGRGLRVIDTDEYKISAFLKEQELIFGKEYKVYYEIINKSNKPLDIKIEGVNDKNVVFDFNKEISIKDNDVVVGNFFVGSIEEEVSHWRTHPCVSANVKINGKNALFKIGISPKYPGKLSLVVPDNFKYEGVVSKCYLNLENNFNEEGTFKFKLRYNKDIEFLNNEYNISLKSKEKKSIPISYLLKNPCIYGENISINAVLENDNINFTSRISGIFKGFSGKFYGETEDDYIICNDEYTLKLKKFNNTISLENYHHDIFKTTILYPRLGMPYSLEFSKTKPEEVEYLIEDETVILKAKYKSNDFKGIILISIIKLYSNGIVKHNYEIINNSNSDKSLSLSHDFRHNLYNTVIPYEGEYIDISIADGVSSDHWNISKITENWLFAKNNKTTRGISWPKDNNIKFTFGYITVDYDLGVLKEKESIITKPLTMFLDTFKNWKDFRSYATLKENTVNLRKTDKFNFQVNDGNPFVKDEFTVKVKDYKNEYFDGALSLSSLNKEFDSIKKEFKEGESIKESDFKVKKSNFRNIDILNLEVDLSAIAFDLKKAVFGVENLDITTKVIKEDGLDVYLVDNGVVEFKGAPEFSQGIHSLKYKDNQWLDSSFPKSKPKSWWNPWIGGIITHSEEMTIGSLEEEVNKGQFVKMEDNFKNIWTGIMITSKVAKHKNYKGMEINQYFLTLPGLPLIMTMSKIVNNTGRYMENKDFTTEMFIKCGDELKDSYFICKTPSGDKVKYKAGRMYNIIDDNFAIYGSKKRDNSLIIYSTSNKNIYSYSNNALIGGFVDFKLSVESQSTFFTNPVFFFFNDENVEKKLFEDLDNIKFK